jgi:methyl-accepting chemotaxis protein
MATRKRRAASRSSGTGRRAAADRSGAIAALNRAQMLIELALDGTVLAANDRFLQTMGYLLKDIKGRNHSLFVDSAEHTAAEYSQLWHKLACGECHEGQYKCIARGGEEIWLQGSFNPILDKRGKPIKVVHYATDITAKCREADINRTFKAALDNLPSNVMMTDTNWLITYMNANLQELLRTTQDDIRKDLPQFEAERLIGVNLDSFDKDPARLRGILSGLTKTTALPLVLGGRTLRIIVNPLFDEHAKRLGAVVEWADHTIELSVEQEIQAIVSAFNDGDLKKRIPLAGNNGFHESLARSINQLADNMSEIVGRVKVTAVEVARSADEISQGNADLSQRTEEQAASLQQTASSMEEMTSTVRRNADNAGRANQLAVAARDQAENGGVVVAKAVKAMAEIDEASKKIADIIGVIDEIAFQTNLLALNAAVEAARAGELGRGFAVVASEVRNLAGRSATAAREIKDLIQDSRRKVDEGSSLVTDSGDTLEQLVSAVKQVSDIIAEIAAASQEQSSGIEQVNKAVMQLDAMTQQNSALVEEASAASECMADQARGLAEMMDKYNVSQEEAPFASPARPDTRGGTAPPEAQERRGAGRPWASADAKTLPAKPFTPKAPIGRTPPTVAVANGTDNEWQQF